MQLKAVALKLAEMESFLKRRQIEEDRLQAEIQDAFSELNRSFVMIYLHHAAHPKQPGLSTFPLSLSLSLLDYIITLQTE